MKNRHVLFGLLLLPILTLTCCDSFFDFLNEEEGSTIATTFSSKKGDDDRFERVYISSQDWYSISDLYYASGRKWNHWVSMTLGDKNGITLKIRGDVRNYDIRYVRVFARSKKQYAEGSYYEKEWPVYSNGNCQSSLYIKTGFAGNYGFTAYIDAIYGSVKPSEELFKDKTNFLWKKIEEDDGTVNYSFSGMQSSTESETLRLPEKIDDIVPTRIGYYAYDMYGLENVKKLIIPANYTNITIQSFWKRVNFEEFYYEGNESDLIVGGAMQKSYLKFYRETEPNPDVDSDEYVYWHYVDGCPQIW